MPPATIDRDMPGPSTAGEPERVRSQPARFQLRWDRRYLVGGFAGVLIGAALAVPVAYALLRISPDTPPEPPKGRSGAALQGLLDAGVRCLLRKDPEAALLVYRAAETFYPRSALVQNGICATLNELQRYVQAARACDKALAIDPILSLARNNLNWAREQILKARSARGPAAHP